MPKQNIIATNFTSGEVSPLVRGRVDAQKYANGLETCENFIVRPQGPIWRRSGTKFMGQSKFHDSKTRLVAFEYSDTQGYILQFGGPASVSIELIENNGSGLFRIKSTAHKLTTGMQIRIRNVTNYPAANGVWTITRVDADKFTLNSSTFAGSGSVDGTWSHKDHGYIHFWKDDGQLFETTTTELEAFKTESDSGFTRIAAKDITGDEINVPGWGPLSVKNLTDNGTLTVSNNGSNAVRITTSIPHTLRTGALIYVQTNAYDLLDGYSFTITRINEYTIDLDGSTYAVTSPAPGSPYTVMYSNGVLVGDRIYISGADNYPEISEKFLNLHRVENWHKFTTNIPYTAHVDGGGNEVEPIGEEGHVIPIEIATPYTESDLPELRFVQSADVLYIIHPDYPVYKLTRLDNDGDRNDWLFAKVDFKDGPYLPLNSLAPTWDETTPANGTIFKDVYFELSSYSHTATCKSATAFAADGGDADTYSDDINKYIEYKDGDQWRLAQLPATLAASATTATVDIIDNVLLYLDESIKYTGRKTLSGPLGFKRIVTYNAGSPNVTPSLPGAGKQAKLDPNNYATSTASTITSNFSNTFGLADIGKFFRFFETGAGGGVKWAKIKSVNTSKSGKEAEHDTPVTMASNNATGNFEIINHVRTAILKSHKNGAVFAAFKSTDVNRLVRIGWGGRWVWCKISAYTSSSEVSVALYEDIPRDPHDASKLAGATGSSTTTGRSYDWRMGSWSDTTGYPSCGVFHEQRLWFGRTNTEPQSIWGSVSGDFENFSPTELDSAVLEDNAINFTIASTKANPIKWMTAGPTIVVGTVGAEWQVKSSSVTSEPITPLNIVVVPHTTHGSNASVQPLRIGNSTFFADRPGNKIRELIYDFQQDGLVSNDLTYLSEHILRNGTGASHSAYQQEPNNLCWFVLNDGTLAAVTINKDQEIVAWHRHIIKDAIVEGIAVVPSSGGTYDDVWICIKRTINGSTKRTVEKLQPDFYPISSSNRTGMNYLDGFIELTGYTEYTIKGLYLLEGKTVTAVVNGEIFDTPKTVTNGAITFSTVINNQTVIVGLLYTSTAKSLPPEGGSAFGTSQGKIKKIAKYNVRLLNSLALDYGFNTNGQSLNSITNLHEDGTNTNFYTGTKELIPNNPYDAESQWTLSTSKPYPLNILSVTMTVETGE